jgi:hypothetical protein
MSTTAVAAAPKPGTAPDASPTGEDASGTLAELLNTGRFAEYHLEKAKMALANGELAAADYQAAASLCHDHLPEAVAMRAEIKRRKAG